MEGQGAQDCAGVSVVLDMMEPSAEEVKALSALAGAGPPLLRALVLSLARGFTRIHCASFSVAALGPWRRYRQVVQAGM